MIGNPDGERNEKKEPSPLKTALMVGGLVLQGIASIAFVGFMGAVGKAFEKDGDGNLLKPKKDEK